MGAMRWVEIVLVVYVVISLYRRISMRGMGAAVGRAKAKVSPPKSSVPAAKPESNLSSDFRALDLKPSANFDEVKHAYRELAKVWHPDRFGNDAKLKDRANTKLGEINAAYERLKTHFGK